MGAQLKLDNEVIGKNPKQSLFDKILQKSIKLVSPEVADDYGESKEIVEEETSQKISKLERTEYSGKLIPLDGLDKKVKTHVETDERRKKLSKKITSQKNNKKVETVSKQVIKAEKLAEKADGFLKQRSFQGKLVGFLAGDEYKNSSTLEKAKYLKELKNKKFKDVWKDSNGFFGMIKNILMWTGVRFFSKTETGKKIFSVVDKVEKIQEKADGYIDKAKSKIEGTKKHAHGAKNAYQTIRQNPEVSRKSIGALSKKMRTEMLNAQRKYKGNPLDLKIAVSGICNNFIKNGEKIDPSEFKKMIKSHKIPGLELKKHGSVAVIRVTTMRIFESMRTGDWDDVFGEKNGIAFKEELKDLVPIMGTVRSYDRLGDEFSDLPKWARQLDLAIAGLGDGIMVAGLGAAAIGSVAAGVGAVPGLAATATGAGIKTIGRSLLRGGIRLFSRKSLKSGAKSTGKVVGKEAGFRAIFETAILGMEKMYNKIYPDGIITEIKPRALNMATNKLLSPSEKSFGKKMGWI